MKFHDPKAIPEEYYTIINSAVKWCKDNYPARYRGFFETLTREVTVSEIKQLVKDCTRSRVAYENSNDAYESLYAVLITLDSCVKKNLKPVCTTYKILMGHLSYAGENNVYETISSYALEAMTQSDEQPTDETPLSGDVGDI